MATQKRLKVYAYYYPWYKGADDKKWETVKEFAPLLGLYDSSDPAVIRQHVEWAIEYGIDGFLVEWFGRLPLGDAVPLDQNLATLRTILPDYPDFEFAVFYDQVIRFGNQTANLRFDDQDRRRTFLEDLDYVARSNFDHPNYFRINGRPVVAIYLTRAASGDYADLIDEARTTMESYGEGRPFIVGDEIWWQQANAYVHILDGVTAYSLMNGAQLRNRQIAGRAYQFACAEVYQIAQTVANGMGKLVIPHVGHAYNDGNLRGNLPLVPTYEAGKLPDYRLDMIECMKSLSGVWADNPHFRSTGNAYLFVNSFNEWPERSVVEPTLEIETYNKLFDFRFDKYVYLQPPRFEYLEGIREGKRQIETNVLPKL